MKQIDIHTAQLLSQKAVASARLRAHHNFHAELSDPVQRLCFAGEPGTYVRPHKHPVQIGWEMFLLCKGSATAVLFDDSGDVIEATLLDANAGALAVELPAQTFHTIVINKPGTILFEVKPGPYTPLAEEYFASWAPKEGEPGVPAFLSNLQASIGMHVHR